MKLKTILSTLILTCLAAFAAMAQTTNTAPALSQSDIASLDNSINSLLWFIPSSDVPMAAHVIGLLALLAGLGRVISGYLRGGLLGAFSGFFGGHNNAANTATVENLALVSKANAFAYPQKTGAALGNQAPLFVGLLCCGLMAGTCSAQTVIVTNPVAGGATFTTTNTGFTVASFLSGGWAQAGKDAMQFIEGTTNSGIIQVEGGVLYGMTSKSVGGFADVMLPVGGTNSVFGAGFGVAYLNNNFYDATINARLGSTYALPLIKIPVYTYIESGGGYNISKQEAVAQAFAGVTLPIPITADSTLTIGAAIGKISDVSENVLAAGGSYTFKW